MVDALNIDRAEKRVSGVAPTSVNKERPTTHVREAEDAGDHTSLKRDPADQDGKLEVGLDESFPTSDPPAITSPGGGEPAPSSGYDEKAEAELEAKKAAAK